SPFRKLTTNLPPISQPSSKSALASTSLAKSIDESTAHTIMSKIKELFRDPIIQQDTDTNRRVTKCPDCKGKVTVKEKTVVTVRRKKRPRYAPPCHSCEAPTGRKYYGKDIRRSDLKKMMNGTRHGGGSDCESDYGSTASKRSGYSGG